MSGNANRLTHLDASDPFYPHRDFPKLITPQWVGEKGVDAVVTLAIDDMRDPAKYEAYLRPILERLKQIDGRAPVSIMTVSVDPQNAQLQAWLQEGLSLEVHTLTHPCPLLQKGNFTAAANAYHGGVDLMSQIPGNKPVAYRMPCCDSMNSPSPRFFAELFNHANPAGQFLGIDSSIMNITTTNDPALQRELVVDADGRERFRKYLPTETNAAIKVSMKSFATTIEDYPYPYVIGKLCWELPTMVPSDWEAFNLQGASHERTVADMRAALDVAVIKKGTFNLIFHPHGWLKSEQVVELIDYAVAKYGGRVKFLTFKEALERLNRNLLANQPLRAANGQDNGVRLMDINNDGFQDVVIANESVRLTRVWNPAEAAWMETVFSMPLITINADGERKETGVRFGVFQTNGFASAILRSEAGAGGAWRFDGRSWVEDKEFWNGLELDGRPLLTSSNGRDRGVRLRDVDLDGRCEVIAGNESQNAVFSWNSEQARWERAAYSLPAGTAIVDFEGRDAGLRFVDINEDGYDDVLFSNERAWSLHLFVPKPKLNLSFGFGWTQKVRSGKRGDPGEIPMVVREGPHRNNGAWFHSRHMWVQNEDTAHLPDKVDRRSFEELLAFDTPPPLSPQDSLKTIQVRPGFRVELVAAEPLVKDPIAFDWGADGRLWVVEMGDYPVGIDGKGKPGGIVRFLEDLDGDGVYDKSTVFLDGLNFPTGVMPWGNGVLVSAAPDIFYAEDTNGDGKADIRKVILTGFREGNQQHRVNGFAYGLDNWVYVANGDSGGTVTSPLTGKSQDIRGRDIRFKPDTGEFETVAGQTQFGRHRDDWGNWFGNNNPNWGWHYHLPEHYLARNPHLAVKSTRHFLANQPNATRVYPISAPMQRFNWPDLVNTLTSACSLIPYRDNLFGPDFVRSAFICEPANNLVHRMVLEPDGVTFTGRRAKDEQDREFLASSDNWFRPTMAKAGPDGALYIADMYRLVIEHIEYALPGMEKQIDLRAGADMGRIYRVVPIGGESRSTPRLDKLDTAGLVAALESPSGWQRDTAQRLLVNSGDKAAVMPLRDLLASSPEPKARLHAICALDGLNAVDLSILRQAWKDSHSSVRAHAVRIAEKHAPEIVQALQTRRGLPELINLTRDKDIRVRYQLAFSLGEFGNAGGFLLARLALRDFSNPQMQPAILSSAPPSVADLLGILPKLAGGKPLPDGLLEQLISLAAAMNHEAGMLAGLKAIFPADTGSIAADQLAGLAGFLDGLARRGVSLAQFQAKSSGELKEVVSGLDSAFGHARTLVIDDQATDTGRLTAIRLLARGSANAEQDIRLLADLLHSRHPSTIQQGALAALGRLRSSTVSNAVLAGWRGYSPSIRGEVINLLFSRPEWIQGLLSAIESGDVPAGQISPTHRQKLLSHSQPAVRERASKLFAVASEDRQRVVKDYRRSIQMTGDPAKGLLLYRQHCASCHQFRGEGVEIGPDLGALSSKSPETLLAAILDPNQAIAERYINFSAVTRGGQELSGIIVAETPTSITLKTASGAEEVILRRDLQEFSSSGLSMMPEGFENLMSHQDMADLIAFLSGEGDRGR